MLLGKTIVITGISSGIGARIGELAVALGADIVGVDINPPARPTRAMSSSTRGSPKIWRNSLRIGVVTGPGLTALTRKPRSLNKGSCAARIVHKSKSSFDSG